MSMPERCFVRPTSAARRSVLLSLALCLAASQSPAADAVVMKALQKRPGDRYQSMRELISDIHDLEFESFR